MKTFASRFLSTFLNIFKLIIYVGGALVFFYLMGIDNFQVRNLSRTLVVMVITYVMLTYFLAKIYGGYDIGIRKPRMIFLSLELSMLITNSVTYVMLLIMNTNDANNREFEISSFGYFILSLLLQTMLILIFTGLGGALYDAVRPAEKVLIISSRASEEEDIAKAVATRSRNFDVVDTCRYDAPDIK